MRGVGVCDNHLEKGFLTHPLPPLKRGENLFKTTSY